MIIAVGLCIVAWNWTDASRRWIKLVTRVYLGERAGDASAVVVRYAYYVAAALFLAIGIYAVISGALGCGGGSCGAAALGR